MYKSDTTKKDSKKPKRRMSPNSLVNLKPFTLRGEKEARKNGEKGGVKSGEVRREERKQKEIAKVILSLPLSELPLNDEAILNICDELGVTKEVTVGTANIVALVKRALGKEDVNAMRELLDLDGSKEKDKTNIYNHTSNYIISSLATAENMAEVKKRGG